MPNAWCVRADNGAHAKQFRTGGYVTIGWPNLGNLAGVSTKEQLQPIYKAAYPADTSAIVIGQGVGQLARFLLDIAAGDLVVTPDADTALLWYGMVRDEPYLFEPNDPACPFPHRRKVDWAPQPLLRSSLSIPLQATLKSSLTVFAISPATEILKRAGLADPRDHAPSAQYDPYGAVLTQILTLDAQEFEILVAHLLAALGFDAAKVTGKPGDGGVDATGELNVSSLATMTIYVQAKRYQLGTKITAATVKALRQAIPFGGQGAFITTADYQTAACEIAGEPGFPRIGLINGQQLVDLLIEHWSALPDDVRKRLGLRSGLVPV